MVVVAAVFLNITIGFSLGIGAIWYGGWDKFTNVIDDQSLFRKIISGILVVIVMLTYTLIARAFYKLMMNEN